MYRQSFTPTAAPAGRRSLWRTGVVEIIGLILFVVLVWLLGQALPTQLGPTALLVVGIVLAAVPAALWLGFFYAQDRREPEPLGMVLGVAALGALLAAAVGQPLITGFFRTADWLTRDRLIELLGSILVIGVVQELCKLLAVRLSVYGSAEFDQRADGVVYGTAAGVGYAFMLNLSAVLASRGFVDLGAGALATVVTALAQGALGGLLGFFIARAKFDDEPAWWLAGGLMLTAVLNGTFSYLIAAVSRPTLSLSEPSVLTPWLGLALAALVAAGLLATVYMLLTRSAANPAEAARITGQDTLSLGLAVLVALLLLGGGLLVRNSTESRTVLYDDTVSGATLAVPAGWRIDDRNAADGVLTFRAPTGAPPVTLQLRRIAVAAEASDEDALAGAASDLALARGRDLTAFQQLGDGGYAYVRTPDNLLADQLPIVVVAQEQLIRRGTQVYAIAVESSEAERDAAARALAGFVERARLP